MKVLWLSHFLPHRPTGHGALQRSHNLLVEAARKHEVHLAAVAVGDDAASRTALQDGIASLRPRLASVHAFPVASSPLGLRLRQAQAAALSAATGPSYWDRLFSLRALAAHLRNAARDSFDLVHLDIVFLSPYLAMIPGVPIALNHHNIESDLLRRRAGSGSAIGRWFFGRQAAEVSFLECRLAQQAGVNLVVSALDGARLRAIAGDVGVTVVPNGVDVEFFKPTPGITAEDGHLIFAGGMDWFPNREAMVYLARELWPALRHDRAARRMTVVGRNPPPELLDAAKRDHSLQVTGFVDDVRPYISSASIYLCPITVGGGTRLKILDALAMGRPLVSTDLGVEGLDLEEGVHYLPANTTAEFVNQVRRLEGDRALATSLAAAGRSFVEQRYAWPVIAQALDEGWRRAVAG